MRVGYLGPQGTFTEEALLKLPDFKDEKLISYPTEQDVLLAVQEGKVSKGVVPIENSIEGSINITLDMLVFEVNLVIEKEIIAPVRHNLISHQGIAKKDIKMIISHPQATAQCRKYLAKNFSKIPIEAASSTAEAVKRAAESGLEVAAIGTRLAAKLYGLEAVEKDIEDFKDNKTRFVVVGKKPAPRTGDDKTSVACFIYEDRPGMLLQILQEFAYRYINLTKIQSRPTKKALGQYYFWIDMEGHLKDREVKSVLDCLKCKLRDVKVLGSYPRD